MTLRDSGQNWQRIAVPVLDVRSDSLHQLFDCTAIVISGDVSVKVFPNSLDSIRLRTVWWEEVKSNSVRQSVDRELRESAAVNGVVVEN